MRNLERKGVSIVEVNINKTLNEIAEKTNKKRTEKQKENEIKTENTEKI